MFLSPGERTQRWFLHRSRAALVEQGDRKPKGWSVLDPPLPQQALAFAWMKGSERGGSAGGPIHTADLHFRATRQGFLECRSRAGSHSVGPRQSQRSDLLTSAQIALLRSVLVFTLRSKSGDKIANQYAPGSNPSSATYDMTFEGIAFTCLVACLFCVKRKKKWHNLLN